MADSKQTGPGRVRIMSPASTARRGHGSLLYCVASKSNQFIVLACGGEVLFTVNRRKVDVGKQLNELPVQ